MALELVRVNKPNSATPGTWLDTTRLGNYFEPTGMSQLESYARISGRMAIRFRLKWLAESAAKTSAAWFVLCRHTFERTEIN